MAAEEETDRLSIFTSVYLALGYSRELVLALYNVAKHIALSRIEMAGRYITKTKTSDWKTSSSCLLDLVVALC